MSQDPQRSRFRWRWWYVPVAFALVVGVLVYRAGQERNSIQQELLAAGYPLNWKQLETWYPRIPDELNAADALEGLLGSLKEGSEGKKGTVRYLVKPDPGQSWSDEDLVVLRSLVATNRPKLKEFHVGLQRPQSRYSIDFSKGHAMLIPHLGRLKGAANQFDFSAQVAAMDRDPVQATSDLLDIFRLAWTLESEPILISALVRNAILYIGADSMERVLAVQALPSESLERLQNAVLEGIRTNGMERGLAGELAFGSGSFRSDAATKAQLAGLAGVGPGGMPSVARTIPWMLYDASGLANADHKFYLTVMSQHLAVTRLDYPLREAAVKEVEKLIITSKTGFPPKILSGILLPALSKSHRKDTAITARLRVAAVALAVERYRADHGGSIPSSLSDLVPKYIGQLPPDPENGKPLRFLAREKGFVVYSAGEDGEDDGGTRRIPGAQTKGGHDVVFEVPR